MKSYCDPGEDIETIYVCECCGDQYGVPADFDISNPEGHGTLSLCPPCARDRHVSGHLYD